MSLAPRLHPLSRSAPSGRALPQAAAAGRDALALALLREGAIAPEALVQALEHQARDGGRLVDILRQRAQISEAYLMQLLSRQWGVELADLDRLPADPRLLDQWGARACLRDGLLPWRQIGDMTVIATPYPEEFERHRPSLTRRFGRVAMALTTPERLEAMVLLLRGRQLDQAALTSVSEEESCRNWGGTTQLFWIRAGAALALASTMIAPVSLIWVLSLWALTTLAAATAMKGAAIFAMLRHAPPPPPAPGPTAEILPTVSIMVALYNEGDIAARLVRRLSRLDYPRGQLDILLVVEEIDQVTRQALRRATLPGWMRVVVVPDGAIRTKPRALNHALGLCRGSIIGVYDAEDAPEPDQIRKVAARFAGADPRTACLQGMLDFYNPRTNWLSRCFTMEYASWFRIFLPGIARLGLPVPLGGTTLFFRRAALEELGAWDAFNVTEDADLGMRLARHGYRTELIPTTTFEEANCRALPWIKQRSRWLKGYMMTYGVHMRQPRLLLRQLGWWQFLGFQVLFLSTISQYLLTPMLWSFWLVPLGLDHPVVSALPGPVYQAMVGVFLATEALLIAVTLVAMRLTSNRMSWAWAPLLHLYFPLGALASYKAAWELVHKPFWWDKTSHGHFDTEPEG